MAKTYDLVVPLGYACSCSQTLRRAGLQLASFPWDWVGVPPPPERCRYIVNGFKDFVNLEDLKRGGINNTYGFEEILNTHNELIFLHDFASNVPLVEQYPAVAAKYARRTARLERLLRAAKRVLLVTIDGPTTPEPTSPASCVEAAEIMQEAYPNAKFDYLLLNLDDGRNIGDRIDESPFPNLRRIAFDYASHAPDAPKFGIELDQLADFLRGEYAVVDYRTKEEIAAHESRKAKKRSEKLKRRMEELGAETRTQYWLYRIRRIGRRLLSALVAARVHGHRYAQIVPLGINCEVAFRFFCRWGFVDSSLFAWAACRDLETLTAALGNLDLLADGRFEMNMRAHMWRNVDCNIQFHGKLQWKSEAPPSQSMLEQDLEDLRGRLRHLVGKFRRYLSNGEETLFVHRLAESDTSSADLATRLDALEAALVRLGAKNWKLLVVCQARDWARMPPPSPHRFYRRVREFNPTARVAFADLGDPVGWTTIFSESAPAKIQPKSHAFKFE